jgi:hypothetical protein
MSTGRIKVLSSRDCMKSEVSFFLGSKINEAFFTSCKFRTYDYNLKPYMKQAKSGYDVEILSTLSLRKMNEKSYSIQTL